MILQKFHSSVVRHRHKYMSEITDYLVLLLLLNKIGPTLVFSTSVLCALFKVISGHLYCIFYTRINIFEVCGKGKKNHLLLTSVLLCYFHLLERIRRYFITYSLSPSSFPLSFLNFSYCVKRGNT